MYQYVCFLGIEPTTFWASNAMLYHWATGTMLILWLLSAQNSPNAEVNLSARFWINSCYGRVLHATTCKNSHNVMYMTVPVIVINILHCCWSCSCCLRWRDNHPILQWSALLQSNSTKRVLYEINNIYTHDRPIWTFLNVSKSLVPYLIGKIQYFTLPVSVQSC